MRDSLTSEQAPESRSPERLARLEALIDLAARLNQPFDPLQLPQIIIDQAAHLLEAEHAFLLLLNPRTRETLRTINRLSERSDDPLLREIERNTSGYIMCYDRNLLSENILLDERFKGIRFDHELYRSVVGIPLRNENILIGALVMINKKSSGCFSPEDLALCVKLGHIVSPFLHNTQAFQNFFMQPLPDTLLLERYAKFGLIGQSMRFVALLKEIEAAARSDVRVLLEGASGTGKELVARAIHRMSERWSAPFVAIDCGAIPAALMESEMMGHVRGAFTGANTDRKGMISEADHGTLFMDEVVNLPLELQAKLLRVLQEGEVRPVGSNKSQKIDVRIVAAASSSLERCVELGHFRQDLYYRLYVFPVAVPSLNERREDIGLLADHFLKIIATRQHKKVTSLSPEVLDFFKRRSWPGNVRELENLIERLVTLVPVDLLEIDRNTLPEQIRREMGGKPVRVEERNAELSFAERLSDYEADLIYQALEANAWNQSCAARALKMPVQTLHNKMVKFKIERPDPGRGPSPRRR